MLAAACSLAIAIPVAAQIGDDGESGTPAISPGPTKGTDEGPPERGERPPCGEWLCLDSHNAARPIGAVVDTGDRVAGVPVLLFAERHRQLDHQTDEPVRTPTIVVGYEDPETHQLLSRSWAGVPRYPFPEQLPLPMDYSAGGGPWVVVGSVTDPTATDVTAVTADGESIEVGLSDREIAPGIRVFWASGSMSDRDLKRTEFRVLDADGNPLAACEVGDCGGTG